MYRFTTEDRGYNIWSASEDAVKTPISLDVCPVSSKLFNFDMFTIQDGVVTICDSPTRINSIAGVLVLENDKRYGKNKDKFLYKCIPDDRRLPIFLVSHKIKLK